MNLSHLFVDVRGTGKPLLCLHGWGMHSGIFEPLVERLYHQHQLLLMDLPGHGDSQPIEDFDNLTTLANLVKNYIASVTTEKINILAWSMGGLLGQWLAVHAPDLVNKLVLVSGTACFENKTDWEHGIKPDVLQQFAQGLTDDYAATLDRFLALQFMGADEQKTQLRYARELLAQRPAPNSRVLAQGLQLLSHTDLRAESKHIHCPVLLLSGERDKLVPTTAVRSLAENVKNGKAVIFKGSGHAPFLSRTSLFSDHLKQFLYE